MHSTASQSIVARDRSLTGLATLLDVDRSADAMVQCGIPLEAVLRTEYLRYKPGRRCISLVRTTIARAEQHFVLSAFPAPNFGKQLARTTLAESQGKCWQDAVRQIRIDRFPFDLGLRHIEKCSDSSQRSRLLRRILGKSRCREQICLEFLAYKPGRRFVAAGIITPLSPSPTTTEPLHTIKFYSATQYRQTLRRLQAIQATCAVAPQIVASHEHYKAVALEWIHGILLADFIASGQTLDGLLFQVGSELARLHKCPSSRVASPAASAHVLSDIASYIGFIRPSLAELAIDTATATATRLSELLEQRTIIHGDFYAKQVLIDRDTIRFIDFDQAGLGNPYQDVGNFVAKLYWQQLALGQNILFVKPMAESFLLGYQHAVSNFDERAYRVHLAAGLMRCATHPFRHAMANWPDVVHNLLVLARGALQSTLSSECSVSIA